MIQNTTAIILLQTIHIDPSTVDIVPRKLNVNAEILCVRVSLLIERISSDTETIVQNEKLGRNRHASDRSVTLVATVQHVSTLTFVWATALYHPFLMF